MIYLEFPWTPPSLNHMYITRRGGGRALSEAGKKFKAETKTFLVQKYPTALRFFKPNKPYHLYVRFSFPEVETKGYATGKANRYKTFDATNRIKILEDVLKDVAGIDDAQNMVVTVAKEKGPEMTRIWVWSPEEEESPFDELRRNYP